MGPILQLARTLQARPPLEDVAGIRLRTYRGPQDIGVWLDIRHRAFAREKIGVRRWSASDFETEFLAKPWWSPERLWFAMQEPSEADDTGQAVGTVALAERGSGPAVRMVIHWLAVLPSWRRRGIGGLLVAALERCCWDAGQRKVFLETHAGWTSALRFYESRGYRPVGLGAS